MEKAPKVGQTSEAFESTKVRIGALDARIKSLDLIITSLNLSRAKRHEIKDELEESELEVQGLKNLLAEGYENPDALNNADMTTDITELESLYDERFSDLEEAKDFYQTGKHQMLPTSDTSSVYFEGLKYSQPGNTPEAHAERTLFHGVDTAVPPLHLSALAERLETLGISWEELAKRINEKPSNLAPYDDSYKMADILEEFKADVIKERNVLRLEIPSEAVKMEVEILSTFPSDEHITTITNELDYLRKGGPENKQVKTKDIFKKIKGLIFVGNFDVYPDEIKATFFTKLMEKIDEKVPALAISKERAGQLLVAQMSLEGKDTDRELAEKKDTYEKAFRVLHIANEELSFFNHLPADVKIKRNDDYQYSRVKSRPEKISDNEVEWPSLPSFLSQGNEEWEKIVLEIEREVSGLGEVVHLSVLCDSIARKREEAANRFRTASEEQDVAKRNHDAAQKVRETVIFDAAVRR